MVIIIHGTIAVVRLAKLTGADINFLAECEHFKLVQI